MSMSHTYTNNLYHIVFSTKERQKFKTDIRERLHAYLGGAANKNGCRAIEVGGTTDHVHLLLRVPPTIAVSKAVQLIKVAGSRWMHDEVRQRSFEWQQGYAAFTVSQSQRANVAEYSGSGVPP